jgi:DNA-binding GntR family transcriptional regulator
VIYRIAAREQTLTTMFRVGTPIVIRSLSDEIVEIMQRSILMGSYEPGQPLVERELAAQFGVSSIPVREALQILENRGLVKRRRNRSCSVVELTPEEVGQIGELRRLLEPEVVRWACHRMTAADLNELEHQLAKLRTAAEANDVADFFYQDLLFHQVVWSASGNCYAADTLKRAVSPLFAFGLMRAKGETPPALEVEVRKHERLVQALRARDGSQAAAALLELAEQFQEELESQSERKRKR